MPDKHKTFTDKLTNVLEPAYHPNFHEKENLIRYEESHFVDTEKAVWNYSLFTEDDIINFQRGTHYTAYRVFGNKQFVVLDQRGSYFAVWAPNATYISVIGDFNKWDTGSHPLYVRLDKSGIWEGFIPGMEEGEAYKYHIHGYNGLKLDKGDPYAHYWEKASQHRIHNLRHRL